MLAMFAGGISIKAILIGLATVGLVTVLGLGYWHYNGLVKQNAELSAQVQQLVTSLALEQAARAQVEQSVALLKADLWEQRALRDEARSAKRRLSNVFSDHDLAMLAFRKPGLVESRVNAATADLMRQLERTTSGRSDPEGGRPQASPPTRAPRPKASPVEGSDA